MRTKVERFKELLNSLSHNNESSYVLNEMNIEPSCIDLRAKNLN